MQPRRCLRPAVAWQNHFARVAAAPSECTSHTDREQSVSPSLPSPEESVKTTAPFKTSQSYLWIILGRINSADCYFFLSPPPWNIYSRRSLSCEHRSVSWQIFTPSTSVNTIKCAEDDDGCCCLSCASIHLPAFPWDPQRAFHTINDVSWTNVINWGVSAQ